MKKTIILIVALIMLFFVGFSSKTTAYYIEKYTKEKIDEVEYIEAASVELERVETPIPFKTQNKYDESLLEGKKNILQEGVKGLETITYETTHISGDESIREELGREITKQAIDRIILIGTKPVLLNDSPYPLQALGEDYRYEIKKPVNLRQGPGSKYNKIKSLGTGSKIEAIGENNGWYYIQVDDIRGFVYGDYVLSVEIKEGQAHEGKENTKTDINTQVPLDQADVPLADDLEITYVKGILVVNKGHGLPPSYDPGESPRARAAFNEMKKAAAKEGHSIRIYSGYRSYNYQKSVHNKSVARNGQVKAESYSARPGYSEHQTGLAFDISWDRMTDSIKMEKTECGIWMANNSHHYGFIIRYPKNKNHLTGYNYEPWHFRYLGNIATDVYESGLCLDEYLGVVAPDYID